MTDSQAIKEEGASKTGINGMLVPQKRDLLLMQMLSLLRVLDREQIRIIAGFKSVTRANARLLKLTKAGLLKRLFFVSSLGGKKAIYCLSKEGAGLAGVPANAISRPSDSFILGDKFVAHQLAINEVYCRARSGREIKMAAKLRWRPCPEPISSSERIIPDAYFEIRAGEFIRSMFLEVDLGTEGLPVWNKKIAAYLSLASSGEFERIFQHPRFGVAVVTNSEKRMQSLRSHIAKSTSKLFYFTTLERIKREGFWLEAWFRPAGDQPQSLI